MSKKAKLEPIGAKIIVKPVKEEEKTASGIILPDSAAKDTPNMGQVVAIGTLSDDTKLSEGDKVLFSEYGYDKVEFEGDEYLILEEKKILAIVK